jgi:RecB family endonuclease NucS
MDLLCEDTDKGDLVIIELKKGRPSDEVIGQLARYMGWAREKLAQGRGVRGIVLAPDFDARMRYAARAIPGVELLRYEVRFEIRPEE